MSLIFNAIIYEGILSIIALFVYFWMEPRYNLPPKKGDFFAPRTIALAIITIPFMQFLVGFLIQSKTCETANNFLCVGVPDIFQHSLFYDLFFLRVNDTFNGAHWIDYMYIPIIYFLTYYWTRDPFFSALNSAFMVFIHEFIWFVFYWFEYYNSYQTEGWINDIAFFMLVCTIGFIGITKYRQRYKNPIFFVGIIAFVLFLFGWLVEGFTVSVINNTQLANGNKFLITQWYNDPLTNIIEVLSWTLVFGFFVLNTWIGMRNYKSAVIA